MDNIEQADSEEWREFKREREEVWLALDIEKFRAYLIKYGETQAAQGEDHTLMAGMHYARLNANFISAEAKEISERWLRQHGLNPYPTYG